MSTERQCPLCGRLHIIADDGTIPTWLVTWDGDELGTRRYLSRTKHARLKELRTKYPGRVQHGAVQEERIITNRVTCFIHYEDALSEYNWIKRILVERGDWEEQQEHLSLSDGERTSWDDLFDPAKGGIWIA